MTSRLNVAPDRHIGGKGRCRPATCNLGSAGVLPRSRAPHLLTRFLQALHQHLTTSTASVPGVMFATRSALKASSSGRWLARQARDPFVRARNAAQASLDFDDDR